MKKSENYMKGEKKKKKIKTIGLVHEKKGENLYKRRKKGEKESLIYKERRF